MVRDLKTEMLDSGIGPFTAGERAVFSGVKIVPFEILARCANEIWDGGSPDTLRAATEAVEEQKEELQEAYKELQAVASAYRGFLMSFEKATPSLESVEEFLDDNPIPEIP